MDYFKPGICYSFKNSMFRRNRLYNNFFHSGLPINFSKQFKNAINTSKYLFQFDDSTNEHQLP